MVNLVPLDFGSLPNEGFLRFFRLRMDCEVQKMPNSLNTDLLPENAVTKLKSGVLETP